MRERREGTRLQVKKPPGCRWRRPFLGLQSPPRQKAVDSGAFSARRSQTSSQSGREIPMPYATEENLTDLALKQWEACHSPRLRQIMQSLVKHLHGFVREVDLKEEEWLKIGR